MIHSALYTGTVMHRRFKPTQHRLSYRVFWTLIDLDELPYLAKKLRLFSRERFNLFGFYNSGHGNGSATPLRTQSGPILPATRKSRSPPLKRTFGNALQPSSPIWLKS